MGLHGTAVGTFRNYLIGTQPILDSIRTNLLKDGQSPRVPRLVMRFRLGSPIGQFLFATTRPRLFPRRRLLHFVANHGTAGGGIANHNAMRQRREMRTLLGRWWAAFAAHRHHTVRLVVVFLAHASQNSLLGAAFYRAQLLFGTVCDAPATLDSHLFTVLHVAPFSGRSVSTAQTRLFDILVAAGVFALFPRRTVRDTEAALHDTVLTTGDCAFATDPFASATLGNLAAGSLWLCHHYRSGSLGTGTRVRHGLDGRSKAGLETRWRRARIALQEQIPHVLKAVQEGNRRRLFAVMSSRTASTSPLATLGFGQECRVHECSNARVG